MSWVQKLTHNRKCNYQHKSYGNVISKLPLRMKIHIVYPKDAYHKLIHLRIASEKGF